MKKTIDITAFLLSAFLLISCGGKQQEQQTSEAEEIPYPITIPFESGIEEERDVCLSQIAEKVEYIRLETSDKSLIQDLMAGTILFADNCWYLYEGKALFQFTNEGKFVRKFGAVGQGPGEYNSISHFDIDPKNGLLYMLTDANCINVYSTRTGEFQKAIPVKDITAYYMTLWGEDAIAYYIFNRTGEEENRIVVMDMNGSIIKRYPQYDKFDNHGFFISSFHFRDRYFFHYKDELLFSEIYNDTLFTVTNEGLLPRYILDMGKYKLPKEKRVQVLGDFKQYKALAAPYFQPWVLETEHFIFVPFTNWVGEETGNLQQVVFDKKSQRCYKVKGGYIRNDLGPGLPMHPVTVADNNKLVSTWRPETIMEKAETDPSILEHPQLKGLKEDDNPVLMVVTLK